MAFGKGTILNTGKIIPPRRNQPTRTKRKRDVARNIKNKPKKHCFVPNLYTSHFLPFVWITLIFTDPPKRKSAFFHYLNFPKFIIEEWGSCFSWLPSLSAVVLAIQQGQPQTGLEEVRGWLTVRATNYASAQGNNGTQNVPWHSIVWPRRLIKDFHDGPVLPTDPYSPWTSQWLRENNGAHWLKPRLCQLSPGNFSLSFSFRICHQRGQEYPAHFQSWGDVCKMLSTNPVTQKTKCLCTGLYGLDPTHYLLL